VKLELDEKDVIRFVSLFGDIWDSGPLNESDGYDNEHNIIIANLVGQLKNCQLDEGISTQIRSKRNSWSALTDKAKEHQKDFLVESEEGVPDCLNAFSEIETWLQPPNWDYNWSLLANYDMSPYHLIDALFELLSEVTNIGNAKSQFDIYLSVMSDKEYEQEPFWRLLEVFLAFCQESNS